MTAQPDLFGGGTAGLPEGLAYGPNLIAPEEEKALAAIMAALPFAPFQFHGFEGNRRTVSYGFHYAFDGSGLRETAPIPDWLRPVRAKAAAFAGLPADALEHALLVEYPPGAGIGWHRDRPAFGEVIGISLLAPARLRFRRKLATGWERRNLIAEPRSAYLLRGPARSEWEHSIPPMEELRYSITFRTLRRG
ncbi:MAG TPA: alpha-ketoglutarate-dependent dioxygenase AlkB [Allosphingosinicella sp.]|jgi:alkylated DNA repair dioxygenase AlkB